MVQKIAVVDCETDPFLHGRTPKPFLWGYYDGEKYLQFKDTKKLVEFLTEQEIIVYAHNGGKFDWHFIAEYIPPDSEILIISGRLASFKIGKCTFRDSYNLLPIPLSDYDKTKIDYTKFEVSKRNKNMPEIERYLRDDCIFLFNIVSVFILDYGVNITLASSAMKFWKRNFYTGDDFVSGKKFYETFKPFYYGGRVECFQKGLFKKPFKMYDINSAYPFAMTHNHPWGSSYSVSDVLPKIGIERSFIKLDCISNGALPLRAKDKSLYFPNDNKIREYFITGWEYLAGLKTKNIRNVNIKEVYNFDGKIDFTRYVEHFFKLKAAYKNKDKARYIITKFFLNSLYGKFGSNPNKYHNYNTLEPRYIASCEKIEGKKFAGTLGKNALMSRPLDESEMFFYNIATAASITGFVRAMLFKAICSSRDIMYCDTDCIVAAESNLSMGDALGQWNLEGNFKKGGIVGKKLYAFYSDKKEWKIASKGVKLSADEIISICQGATVTYKKDSPTFGFKKPVTFIERKIRMLK